MINLKESGFYKGINLGGWMSQCDYSENRLDNFITEADFEKIASWGFDHVRLPVDYNVFQRPDGAFIEQGVERIDRAIELCGKYGLCTVLDLHKTQGFSFDAQEHEAGFFENEKYQDLFYKVWEEFSARYAGLTQRLMFDLLNEVTEPSYLPAWMRISKECIRRIRMNAPDVKILVGSYHHNHATAVLDLDRFDDPNVVYSFHCYEPIAFTHQGAYWMEELKNRTGITAAESGTTEEFFEKLLTPALAYAAETGTSLYCGEYGVIDVVPPEEAVKWFRVFHTVMDRHEIGRAVWSYRQMDFGLSDARMDGVREELLTLL